MSASKDEQLLHKDVALTTAKSRLEVCEQQAIEHGRTAALSQKAVVDLTAEKDRLTHQVAELQAGGRWTAVFIFIATAFISASLMTKWR